MSWKNRTFVTAQIKSLDGEELMLLTSVPIQVQGSKAVATKTQEGYILRLKTAKNNLYTVKVL